MAEQRNKNFLNELEERTSSFTDKGFARFERIMERRGRTAAHVIPAPIGTAPAQPTNTGMIMPCIIPELRSRDNLGIFLKRF